MLTCSYSPNALPSPRSIKSGLLEKPVDMLKNLGYTRFISVKEFLRTSEEKIYPLEKLLVAVNYAKTPLGQIGDIFLIKNL